jgi:hypothetical protein
MISQAPFIRSQTGRKATVTLIEQDFINHSIPEHLHHSCVQESHAAQFKLNFLATEKQKVCIIIDLTFANASCML